jgi:hypothetical protein
MKKGFGSIAIVIAGLIILLGGGMLYAIEDNKSEIEGWKVYKNNEFGFKFEYPSELTINEKRKDGAWGITEIVELSKVDVESEDSREYVVIFGITNPYIKEKKTGEQILNKYSEDCHTEPFSGDSELPSASTILADGYPPVQSAVRLTHFLLKNGMNFSLVEHGRYGNSEFTETGDEVLGEMRNEILNTFEMYKGRVIDYSCRSEPDNG